MLNSEEIRWRLPLIWANSFEIQNLVTIILPASCRCSGLHGAWVTYCFVALGD
jgi:hypothetical protein